MADGEIQFELFRYDPNLGAAVFFVILFTAASALHTYQYYVTKTWFFTAFVVGCWCKLSNIQSPMNIPSLTRRSQSKSSVS